MQMNRIVYLLFLLTACALYAVDFDYLYIPDVVNHAKEIKSSRSNNTTNVNIRELMMARSDQSISIEGWLGQFITTMGKPSESQFITITGTNLTSDIGVSPVSGFEYSINDSTWADTLSFSPSYSGPMFIRLKGEELGTVDGNVVFSSGDAPQSEKYVSGKVNPVMPVISVDGWVGQFSTIIGTPSESQYYYISGTNLTEGIKVNPVTGFEFSSNDTVWSDSLALSIEFEGRIYIRLKGDSIGNAEGYLRFSSTGATDVNKYLYGAVNPITPKIEVEGWLGTFITTVGAPSESQYFTVNCSNMTDSTYTTPLAGYEFSENDTIWADSLSLPINYQGPFYIRLKGNAVDSLSGTISFTSNGATQVDKFLTGVVNRIVRKVTCEGSLTSFTANEGNPSVSQRVYVYGTNLTENIAVSSVEGFQYSLDENSWLDSLSLSPTYDGYIYIHLQGNTSGSYGGNMYLTSNDAIPDTVSVSGTVNPPPPELSVTGTLKVFFTMQGNPSTSQVFNITSGHLISSIEISSISGYAYSTTNADPWAASLSLPINYNGSVYVRLTGNIAGSYNGSIHISTTGVTEKIINATGWVNSTDSIQPETQAGLMIGNLDNFYASNASAPLDIPSYFQYEGVNEIVHPDVAYFPNGWNGYKYWMVFTPFPNNDATYENPCIVVSNDKTTWIVPPGLTNPVASYASSANDYYSDPELVMDPTNTTMYLLWRRDIYSTTEKLYVKSTTDGINWSPSVEIMSSSSDDETFISPAIIYNGNQYMMWTVDASVSPRLIRMRTADSPLGPWSTSIVTNIQPLTYDTSNNPLTESWHINVVKVGNQYWMIDNNTPIGSSNAIDLYLGISNDGLQWSFASHPVLSARYNFQYWDQRLYRATMIPINDGQQFGFAIWYSVMRKATNVNPPWRVGYTEAWCAPKNVRLIQGSNDNVTLMWDGFASVYTKSTYYKVQHSETPFLETSWQDTTSWSGNLSYSFVRSAFIRYYYRVIAKIE